MAEVRFEGRVVVVTGAGNGMGRAHAHLLAKRGAKVVVNDIGATQQGDGASEGPATEVVREIREAGGEAVANTQSVATVEGARSIVQTAIDTYGRIDAVVHNAGISNFMPFQDIPVDFYRKLLGVHLDGGFFLGQAAWPHMVKQKYGRFLLITSLAGLEGVSGLADYASAKTAMIGLSRVMSLEGAEHNIKANILGVCALTRATEADMETLATLGGSEEAAKQLAWWREYYRPEFISPTVAWLIHEDFPAAGEIFDAGGGRVKRLFLAETLGYAKLGLTPEDVRDHFDQICDEQGYRVFKDGFESAAFNMEQLVKAGAKPL